MSNFSDWKASIEKNVQITIKACEKVQIEAAKELLSRIEKRTPIGNPALWKYPAPAGYRPGTLRASWVMEQEGARDGLKITISNDQPYAERVENGWSTQAPQGMLRISCMEWSNIVEAKAAKNKV